MALKPLVSLSGITLSPHSGNIIIGYPLTLVEKTLGARLLTSHPDWQGSNNFSQGSTCFGEGSMASDPRPSFRLAGWRKHTDFRCMASDMAAVSSRLAEWQQLLARWHRFRQDRKARGKWQDSDKETQNLARRHRNTKPASPRLWIIIDCKL